VVFFSAAERVHHAKAGAQAERDALRGVASRAQAALTKSEASLVKARAEANAARALKQCGPVCRRKRATEAAAQADVEAAKRDLLLAEKTATADSPLQAPVWLLPAALDLVAFMAIWTGLSTGPVKGRRG
jgi:multidrug resistance efflux pump